jgi:hypothetical protein
VPDVESGGGVDPSPADVDVGSVDAAVFFVFVVPASAFASFSVLAGLTAFVVAFAVVVDFAGFDALTVGFAACPAVDFTGFVAFGLLAVGLTDAAFTDTVVTFTGFDADACALGALGLGPP